MSHEKIMSVYASAVVQRDTEIFRLKGLLAPFADACLLLELGGEIGDYVTREDLQAAYDVCFPPAPCE